MAAWLCTVIPADAYYPFSHVPTDPDSGISVEFYSPFEAVPSCGNFPVQVRIENRSRLRGRWSANLQSTTHHYPDTTQATNASFQVEPGGSLRENLLLPIDAGGLLHTRTTTQIGIQGIGLSHTNSRFQNQRTPPHGVHVETGFFLMPTGPLALANWDRINAHFENQNIFMAGGRVAVPEMPETAAAYNGVESIWVDQDQPRGFSPDLRRALMEWIARGGHLYVAGPEARQAVRGFAPKLSADPGQPDIRFHGMGRIMAVETDDTRELDPDLFERLTRKRDDALLFGLTQLVGLTQATNAATALIMQGLDQPRLRFLPVLGFTLLFALLVGPVNLFFLARKEARHRLFATIPLFSIGASLVAAAVIFLQDGVGLTANRVGFLVWNQDGHEHYLSQVQASVSGLLFSTQFDNTAATWATPLQIGPRQDGGHFDRTTGGRFFGDWFRSRSLQAQYLTQTLHARGGMEILGEPDRPQVISSFPFAIDHFIYVDADGHTWQTTHLTTGSRVELRSFSFADLPPLIRPYGPHFAQKAQTMLNRPNTFLAITTVPEAAVFLADFGPRPRWSHNALLIAGEVDQ